MAMQLAAPHTWPAAILPCFASVMAAATVTGVLSVTLVLSLLIICVLFQASANTFNDYFDYVKGTDSADDNVEVTDATLIYNHVNPKSALWLGIGFLFIAFLLGLYITYCAGVVPLIIALVGAAVVVLYSAGKTPLSYLPLGEIVSGIFFGWLIPIAFLLSDRAF